LKEMMKKGLLDDGKTLLGLFFIGMEWG